MYHTLHNNNTDSVKFSISLAQGLVEKYSSCVPDPVHSNPSTELLPKRLRERLFPGANSYRLKKGKTFIF
jgi:hypothetical protein